MTKLNQKNLIHLVVNFKTFDNISKEFISNQKHQMNLESRTFYIVKIFKQISYENKNIICL